MGYDIKTFAGYYNQNCTSPRRVTLAVPGPMPPLRFDMGLGTCRVSDARTGGVDALKSVRTALSVNSARVFPELSRIFANFAE